MTTSQKQPYKFVYQIKHTSVLKLNFLNHFFARLVERGDSNNWAKDAMETLMGFLPGSGNPYKDTPLMIFAGYKEPVERMMAINEGT